MKVRKMMNREEAFLLVQKYIKNPNSIKHVLAVEAVMIGLARHFNKDQVVWGLTGLLHDLDMEITDYKNDPASHTLETVKILQEFDLPAEIAKAIPTHNEATGEVPQTLMEKCLYSADPITGLIVACTLVLPDKKLASLKESSVLKRMKDKRFAAGANRDAINACENFDMSVNDFVAIAVSSMRSISQQLEL